MTVVLTPSYPFDRQMPGSADPGAPAPSTMRGHAHHGGPANPSVALLAQQFPAAVLRSAVQWGETTAYIAATAVHDVITHLRNDPRHAYDYLVDVTAVEYRNADQPLEVVWHLRSLPWRRFLRLKVELRPEAALEVPSVTNLYAAADWLERECHDMFGITFVGHPDPRRILMWDGYREGHPLRKDFPLRGRFSRAEQLSQALSIDTVGSYNTTELSLAEAMRDLPEEMRQRLRDARTATPPTPAPPIEETL